MGRPFYINGSELIEVRTAEDTGSVVVEDQITAFDVFLYASDDLATKDLEDGVRSDGDVYYNRTDKLFKKLVEPPRSGTITHTNRVATITTQRESFAGETSYDFDTTDNAFEVVDTNDESIQIRALRDMTNVQVTVERGLIWT